MKQLRSSSSGEVERLSEGGTPYMRCCVGVGIFEFPHLIICEDVILIDPHVVRVCHDSDGNDP
jgi:hypothetical protein